MAFSLTSREFELIYRKVTEGALYFKSKTYLPILPTISLPNDFHLKPSGCFTPPRPKQPLRLVLLSLGYLFQVRPVCHKSHLTMVRFLNARGTLWWNIRRKAIKPQYPSRASDVLQLSNTALVINFHGMPYYFRSMCRKGRPLFDDNRFTITIRSSFPAIFSTKLNGLQLLEPIKSFSVILLPFEIPWTCSMSLVVR